MRKAVYIFTLWSISVVFFILSVRSNPSRGGFFDSPDETANYFWASRVAAGDPLWYAEPLEGVGNNLLKPRSFNVTEDRVVPGSFLGEPLLYGYIAKWFGVEVIPFLTPLLASLAVIAFGLLTARLFGREIGVISTALLAVLPPWWYYSARGMYHNVLFVSLVMIGISILVHLLSGARPDAQERHPFGLPAEKDAVSSARVGTAAWLSAWLFRLRRKPCPPSLRDTFSNEQPSLKDNPQHIMMTGEGGRRWLRLMGWGVAGLLIGFSLVVRSSEVGWVALLLISLSVFQFVSLWKRDALRTFPWLGVVLFIACGMFALVPLFTANIELYGAPISIGYRGVQGMELGEFFTKLPEAQFRNLFFAPFGVNLDHVRVTVKSFFIDFLWWWFWPAVTGMLFVMVAVIVRAKKIRNYSPPISNDRYIWGVNWKKWGAYLLVYLCVSLLLIFYYGSWEFSDRIDRRAVSLNTSFLRYWLPVYVMGVPFIGLAVSIAMQVASRSVHRVGANGRSPLPALAHVTIGVLAVGLFAYPSASLVLTDRDESLGAVRTRLAQAGAELDAVKKHVPPEAVIITFPQADKVLFPVYTRLITALANPHDYRAVRSLTAKTPVFYYTHSPPGIVQNLDTPLFARYGLTLIDGQRVFAQRWLWRVMSDQWLVARR